MLLGTDIQAVLTTLTSLDVDVIGLNCSTGPEDMRDAIRYLGEFSPVPVHCIPNAGLPLQGPDGETIFPEQPDPLADTPAGVRRALRHLDRRRLLRHDARSHRGDRRPRRRPRGRAAPRHPRGARVLDDDRHAARAGAAADARRRARQLAGLAQGQGAAARRRLRRHHAHRRGPGRGRRARARRLRRADRAPGRGRADGRGRQAHLAHPAGADPDRLDRARRDQGRARAHSRAARSSTRSTSRPAATSSTSWRRSPRRTAPR